MSAEVVVVMNPVSYFIYQAFSNNSMAFPIVVTAIAVLALACIYVAFVYDLKQVRFAWLCNRNKDNKIKIKVKMHIHRLVRDTAYLVLVLYVLYWVWSPYFG